MKRFGLFLLVLLLATPSWADKKMTVQQVRDLLEELQQQKKSDTEIAFELKQVDLTEQLTRATMNAMAQRAPGPRTMEQIYVLEAESALLPPPTEGVPARPAPDPAQQAVMLSKAAGYVTSTYDSLPALHATRTTLRFQDDLAAIAASSGIQGSAKDATMGSVSTDPGNQYVRYIHSTETRVELAGGVQKPDPIDQKVQWGQNGMIALNQPDPSLGHVFADAQSSGTLHFVRWEAINGRPAAVFTFSVDSKKSRLPIDICCFPTVSQSGIARFYSPTLGSLAGLNGGGATGNMQTNTQWHRFKKSVPYHGAIVIDPDTGTVIRLVTQADFGGSDYVHVQNQRIDYAPVQVGRRNLVVPVKSFTQSEVVPQGDSGVGGHSTRHTYFVSEYKNYTAH